MKKLVGTPVSVTLHFSGTVVYTTHTIGVARGCSGCTCTPRAVKKIRRNLQGKFVSAPQDTKCTPQTEQESIFRTFLLGGLDLEVYLVVLDRLLRATTKKGRQLFSGKSAPQIKSWLHL